MNDSSFPGTAEDLFSHFSVAIPYVVAEQARLLIPLQKVNNLTAKYGDETTAHTYLYVHKQCADITKRTIPLTNEQKLLETDLKKKLMNIYDNIPADLWTDEDRAIFRRKTGLPKEMPVHHRTPIADEVFFKITAKENGEFDIVCRKVDDASRPSLPEGSNSVEVIFDIRAYANDQAQPVSSRTKKLPASVKECPYKEVFTRARFTLKVDPENVGKYIVAYTRWANIHHPEAAGRWSGPLSADVR